MHDGAVRRRLQSVYGDGVEFPRVEVGWGGEGCGFLRGVQDVGEDSGDGGGRGGADVGGYGQDWSGGGGLGETAAEVLLPAVEEEVVF